MKAVADTPRIFVFDAPAPELLMEAKARYCRECQLAGAGALRSSCTITAPSSSRRPVTFPLSTRSERS